MKLRTLFAVLLALVFFAAPARAQFQTNPSTALGAVTTAAPSYTNNQEAPLSLDTSGNLRVSPGAIPAGSSVIGKVGIDQTTPGTTNGVAIVGVNGATALAGNGVTGTGSPRVTIASDNTPFTVNISSQYPAGAIPITASATGTTAATTATLAANVSLKTYLCGFSIRANATAAATGNATVTGTVTGTLNFTQWTAALASGIGVTEPPIGPACIPSSAINTAIAVVSAAPGTGGVISVTAWGYQL